MDKDCVISSDFRPENMISILNKYNANRMTVLFYQIQFI